MTVTTAAALTHAEQEALLDHCEALIRLRLPSMSREVREDATQEAVAAALGKIAAGKPLDEAARLAAYEVHLDVIRDEGKRAAHEAAAGLLADDDSTEDALPARKLLDLERCPLPHPEDCLRPTQAERRADALDALAAEFPGFAEVLSAALDVADATNGSKHPVSMTALRERMGLTERQRKALGRGFPRMLAAAAAAMADVLRGEAYEAGRVRYGATQAVWEAAAAAVEHRKGFGQSRLPVRSGPASLVVSTRYAERAPSPSALTSIEPSWDAATEASVIVPTSAGSTRLPLDTGNDASDSVAETVVRILATLALPAYAESAADRQADRYADRQEGLGAVKRSRSTRRKRDGAVGSPTVTRQAGRV